MSEEQSTWNAQIAAMRAAGGAKTQEPVAYRYKERADDARSSWIFTKKLSRVPAGHQFEALYTAPVSESKAQGVVMPERWNVPRPMWKDARQPYGNPLNHADIEAAEKFNLALDEVARLNADPVQQVSVPDGKIAVSGEALRTVLNALVNAPHQIRELQVTREPVALFADNPINVLIAEYEAAHAYPAAPAADAGLVESVLGLLNRAKVLLSLDDTEWGYSSQEKCKLLADIRDALAAHRSKGG